MEYILGCIVIGIVVAFIVTLIMKGQLKSVRQQKTASNYVVDGSFRLTGRSDVFLYRNVTRRERPKNK